MRLDSCRCRSLPPSFAQRAIARSIEAWCCAEGICTSRATLALFGTGVHVASTIVLLNLGDTDVLIETERVVVRMPHRITEYEYEPTAPVDQIVSIVVKVLEMG
ncbi:MAG: hypothetical protein ACREK8_09480 [Gemmatimonadales bacterium]